MQPISDDDLAVCYLPVATKTCTGGISALPRLSPIPNENLLAIS